MHNPMSTLFLIRKKKCCGNGCLNCPYIPKHTVGSMNTINKILLEPVSILEYYGVDIRVINALEIHDYHLINDLKNLQLTTNIANIGKKGIASIQTALQSLLNGDPPNGLSFETTN